MPQLPTAQRVLVPHAWKYLVKDIVQTSGNFRVFISTMTIQYAQYIVRAPTGIFEPQDLLMLDELGDKLKLERLFTYPIREYRSQPTVEDLYSIVEESLTQAETGVIRIAAQLALAESCLVGREEKLLSKLTEVEEEQERDSLAFGVALFREKRAAEHLRLNTLWRTLSSERLRSISLRQLVESTLGDFGIELSRPSRTTGATASGQISDFGADDVCPICQELLTVNPDPELSTTPFLIRTTGCCNQPYHVCCLLAWLLEQRPASGNRQETCPTCRAEVHARFFIQALETRTEELEGLW